MPAVKKPVEQFKPEFILGKVICLEEQEREAQTQQLNRVKLHFGIVDRAVDRMIDLVLSQQEHIRNLEQELSTYRQIYEGTQLLGQSSLELRQFRPIGSA